jgi:DNA polymerase I-like protein with 3'-5' exonuclease and polymerase domains
LAGKLDVVDVEYWQKGIDTDQVPIEILTKYLNQDLISTWELYKKQREVFSNYPILFKLFRVLCEDLKSLQEIEYNGLKYNTELSLEKANQTKEKIQQIEEKIKHDWCPSQVNINLDSPDHISALLYGGIVKQKSQIPIGTYKTGQKAGQVKMKWIEHQIELPKLFEPIKGSKLQKEGVYSTEEFYLTLLLQNAPKKDPKHTLLELLLKKRELSKLTGTYFEGFPKKIEYHDWRNNIIHTSFNMVVTNTGRPSSKNPNIQNLAEGQKECIISRYES